MSVTLWDKAVNPIRYSSAANFPAGISRDLTVVNPGSVETAPPVLHGLEFFTGEVVDTAIAEGSPYYRAVITGVLSSFDRAQVALSSPTGKSPNQVGFLSVSEVDYPDPAPDACRDWFLNGQFLEPGEWLV